MLKTRNQVILNPGSFMNPLGFYCPPNGCGPDVMAEHDFQRFVAWGMVASHYYLLGPGSEAIAADNEDVYWLRKNFLATVRIGLWAYKEMKAECKSDKRTYLEYQGDQDEGSSNVPLQGEDRNADDWDGGIRFSWHFLRYDANQPDGDDACLLFTLDWGEADDYAGWLLESAVKNQRKCDRILKAAEKWNETHQKDTGFATGKNG